MKITRCLVTAGLVAAIVLVGVFVVYGAQAPRQRLPKPAVSPATLPSGYGWSTAAKWALEPEPNGLVRIAHTELFDVDSPGAYRLRWRQTGKGSGGVAIALESEGGDVLWRLVDSMPTGEEHTRDETAGAGLEYLTVRDWSGLELRTMGDYRLDVTLEAWGVVALDPAAPRT